MTENLAARRVVGPSPFVLALVTWILTVVGVLLLGVLSGGQAMGSPFTTTEQVASRVAEHGDVIRLAAWLQVGSAVPLGILTVTLYTRQQRLRAPGPAIGLFGGILASTMLLLSGLVSWVMSRPELAVDPTVVHALNFLAFITGSVGFVLGIGLLIAGLAVPALVLRLVPRGFAWAGLVTAALCELSFIGMVFEPLQILFPIGRFGGLLWLLIASLLLSRSRKDLAEPRG